MNNLIEYILRDSTAITEFKVQWKSVNDEIDTFICNTTMNLMNHQFRMSNTFLNV